MSNSSGPPDPSGDANQAVRSLNISGAWLRCQLKAGEDVAGPRLSGSPCINLSPHPSHHTGVPRWQAEATRPDFEQLFNIMHQKAAELATGGTLGHNVLEWAAMAFCTDGSATCMKSAARSIVTKLGGSRDDEQRAVDACNAVCGGIMGDWQQFFSSSTSTSPQSQPNNIFRHSTSVESSAGSSFASAEKTYNYLGAASGRF